AREFVERILNIFTIPDEVKSIDSRRWPEQLRASRDFHLCGRPRPSSIPESRPHRSGLSSLPRWQPGFLGRVPRWHGKSRNHSVRRLFLYLDKSLAVSVPKFRPRCDKENKEKDANGRVGSQDDADAVIVWAVAELFIGGAIGGRPRHGPI